MSNIWKWMIGLLVLAVLLLSTVAYRVRYYEAAVVTTFGRADEGSVKNADGTGAGLHWKWPIPIQDVKTYDVRLRVLEERGEEQQTRDKKTAILQLYVSWRISDPLAFSRSLQTPEQAERVLRDRLRDVRAVIGRYDFEQLVSVDPDKLKLEEIEGLMRQQMREASEANRYGVRVEAVGIRRNVLQKDVATQVENRMKETRTTLAQQARSEGASAATNIRSRADSAKQRILAFANRRADAIRAEGEAAAVEQYKVFQQNEEFAIFLRKLDEYKKAFSKNTTFFFDARKGPFDLFVSPNLPSSRPVLGDSSGSN